MFINGRWSPICGHWFWDNNNGATLFCQKLDPKFVSGKVSRINKRLGSDAVRVGKCRRNDQWPKCTWGCNDLGKGNRGCARCGRGQNASIAIKCQGTLTVFFYHQQRIKLSEINGCFW